MPKDYPPFSIEKPLYDQSTLLGRAKQFYTITDPRSLFYSKAQLEQAQSLLNSFRQGTLPPEIKDKDLWNARKIEESMIHPSTGKPIPALFRFSCYAPMNIFIVTAMVLPSTISSIPRTIAIHWYNQSYNAAVNYTNGSSTKPTETRRLIEGYVGAVGSSLAIALGATYITKKSSNLSLAMRTFIRSTLPFSAVVAAGCVNVSLIRRNELTEGVEVYDKHGEYQGMSAIAGKQGILKCCVARFIWNVPAMIIPTAAVGYLSSKQAWTRLHPRIRMGVEVILITAGLMIGVPPALGFFPQNDSIDVDKMEDKFKGLVDRDGNPIKTLYFNKGL